MSTIEKLFIDSTLSYLRSDGKTSIKAIMGLDKKMILDNKDNIGELLETIDNLCDEKCLDDINIEIMDVKNTIKSFI
jgi:hypothetical protein